MTTQQLTDKIKVEIWSDVVCPFCYIGKRTFERALNNFSSNNRVQIEWRSFQLDPHAVTDPKKSSLQHLAESKGISADQAAQSISFITNMAKQVGLAYHLDKTPVVNTFKAHRLLHLAKKYGKQNEMEEALFNSYFTQGKNIDDDATLLQLATNVGLDSKETADVLATDVFGDDVKNDMLRAQQLGIHGVPFFLIDQKFAVSGAQDESVFLKALNKALEEHQKSDIIEFNGDDAGVCGPEGCAI